MKVPFHHQHTNHTCGPAALEMVFNYFRKRVAEKKIASEAKTKEYGTLHSGMINAARREGFYCYVHENASIKQVLGFVDQEFPVIVHYIEPSGNDGHYSVITSYGK